MKRWVLILGVLWLVPGFLAAEEAKKAGRPAPGKLKTEELQEFGKLDKERRTLLELALRMGREMDLDEYVFGSADPGKGGFDCSGSVYYLLKRIGLKPPRTSAGQFDWMKAHGRIVEVPDGVQSFEDPAFAKLKPGDLLFWSGTYDPKDGRKSMITHVQIYLGREKSDGRRVMIGATDGRSYRGSARCGFGVFDFKLPKPGSKARFVGYGRLRKG